MSEHVDGLARLEKARASARTRTQNGDGLGRLAQALETQNREIVEAAAAQAVEQHAANIIATYTAGMVNEMQRHMADLVEQARQQALEQFGEQAAAEIAVRGGQLEARIGDQFDELLRQSTAHVNSRLKNLEPRAAEWDVERDKDGRISSLSNGTLRRTPVRDENGKIIRVIDEPL